MPFRVLQNLVHIHREDVAVLHDNSSVHDYRLDIVPDSFVDEPVHDHPIRGQMRLTEVQYRDVCLFSHL